jgi:RND superfamily putative drug exporter
VVLGALVVAAAHMQPGWSDPNTLAKSGDAKAGLLALEKSGIGSGALLPHEVIASPDKAGAVAGAIAKVDGVHGAAAPAAWRTDRSALAIVFPVKDGSAKAGRDLVDPIRASAKGADPSARLGGEVAQNADFIDAVYGSFPLMIALIACISFVLLARAFRSLLLPAKAVLLNIVSVAAAWGVLQLVWQSGHGSDEIFGIAATGSITSWIPLMVFAFLFGLSMDYEVFILSRMREEYDKTGDTDLAVITGIGRTGRLVTSAALILFLAFAALASGPETDVKVMATGLAAGILLDATVIRALLVPAVVSLFGRWNWVLPPGPAKLLRVEPSLPPRVAGAEAAG